MLRVMMSPIAHDAARGNMSDAFIFNRFMSSIYMNYMMSLNSMLPTCAHSPNHFINSNVQCQVLLVLLVLQCFQVLLVLEVYTRCLRELSVPESNCIVPKVAIRYVI